MRILVCALGSRGDVEPFALVAAALAGRGHQVTLALDPGHHEGRPDAGLTRVALGDLGAAELTAIVARALAGPTPGDRARVFREAIFARREGALHARVAALVAEGTDLVLASEWLLGAPRGDVPTATACHVLAPMRALRALHGRPLLRLMALTRLLERFAPEDIRAAWRYTGFWIDRTPGPLAPEVAAFLAAGEPPLFFTMGSMVGFDGAKLAAAVVTAARRSGRRAIVQRGWAGLDPAPAADVLVVDEVSYPALLPRCAAVFLHGGTGTVAHAMLSGRPLGFLPCVDDQLEWARGLARVGNCAGTASPFRADAEEIAPLVARAVTDPGVATAAAQVADRLRAEDGVGVACAALEELATPSPPPAPAGSRG